MEQHVLDAAGKQLGRIATKAAGLLMGKDSPAYERHLPGAAEVKIVNASKLHLPERKRLGTMHTRYSGYPGGLKVETLDALIARSGHGEVVRKAIYGMLPHNKLRAKAMKRLSVEE
jgi:large subunit ribosomal protein L13